MKGCIAVIPARGGSKRIPRKNIRDFLGKPIIAYSIAAARDSGLFDRVIVSTDDDEIAAVSEKAGAQVPFRRPADLADDFTGTNAVVRHALQALKDPSITTACCIYATAPFVTEADLVEGLRRLNSGDYAFAFSVTSFGFPVQRALRVNPNGALEPLYPQYAQTRSQDLEHAWHDAGQFYWGRAESFLEDMALYASHSIGVPIPRHRVQDIDTLEDWRRAELMFEALQRK